MQVIKTHIDGVVIIEPRIFEDARGYFFESFSQREFDEKVRPIHFVQDNESKSRYGVVRGLHFQKGEFAQAKLVRVVRGSVLDVAVDLREGSETFGKWYGLVLSAENHKQFYISEGFAHGFLVLSDMAEFCYKVTDFWHPGDEGGLAWNDPDIGIEWPQVKGAYTGSADPSGYTLEDGTPLNLSEKDCRWSGIRETWHFQ